MGYSACRETDPPHVGPTEANTKKMAMERPTKRRRRCISEDGSPKLSGSGEEVVDIEPSFQPLDQDDNSPRLSDYDVAASPFSRQVNARVLPTRVVEKRPGFEPPVSTADFEEQEINEVNPFEADDGTPGKHPALLPRIQLGPPVLHPPQSCIMDGFIKATFFSEAVVIRPKSVGKETWLHHTNPEPNTSSEASQTEEEGGTRVKDSQNISPLPPQFGDIKMDDKIDRNLFKFYITAICKGRTVIPSDNTFLRQVTPIAEKSDLVRHAIISLAATYVLDLNRRPEIMKRAELHHSNGVALLSKCLRDKTSYLPGKAEHVLAALVLHCHNSCVTWESAHPGEQEPKWYRGAKFSKKILDHSDSVSNYYDSVNVQYTQAYFQFANRVCQDLVFTSCVYPLDLSDARAQFRWLLKGNKRDQRRIVGFTGLSSKLMHTFERITQLTIRLKMAPHSGPYIKFGDALEKQLENFYQWSSLGEGYKTSDELLGSCLSNRDENGKVKTEFQVTQLIAETYVAAAQIYLQCRAFRRPRNHPLVQKSLDRLLTCVQMQPTRGRLFTAQTPLFSIFIGALVAITPEDRRTITDWFEAVCSGCRGNVPPVWEGTKHLWGWLDLHMANEDLDPETSLSDREAWWERMVEELSSYAGRVSLA